MKVDFLLGNVRFILFRLSFANPIPCVRLTDVCAVGGKCKNQCSFGQIEIEADNVCLGEKSLISLMTIMKSIFCFFQKANVDKFIHLVNVNHLLVKHSTEKNVKLKMSFFVSFFISPHLQNESNANEKQSLCVCARKYELLLMIAETCSKRFHWN